MLILIGCSSGGASVRKVEAKTLTHKYRPEGDQTVHIDLTKVKSEELKKVYSYIDDHFDEHVERLQKWIRQPSISNSGEGIPETAEMVKGFFDQLGCQQTQVYDVGITEWGVPAIRWFMQNATKAHRRRWLSTGNTTPCLSRNRMCGSRPFEGRLVDGKTAGLDPALKKVLIGRGATNSKGPEMSANTTP